MKKTAWIMVACSMTLALAACGGKKETAAPTTTAAATTAATTAASTTTAGAEEKGAPDGASKEMAAAVEEYNAMIDRYNAVVDKINADEAISAMPEVTALMNEASDMLNEVSKTLDENESLSDEQMKGLTEVIENGNILVDEMDSLLANYGGKTVVTINATVVNDTEADLYTLAISPANDESWGGNLLVEPLVSGGSGTLTMSITEDSLVWDIMAADSEGTSIEFLGLDFSDVNIDAGATITLSAAEGGEYVATVE